ncbi:P-loop NTPase fold protein [Streptomyces sp. NBC_01478]|uniref:P-loop NTPase fold protein n=1 Tax=Streptomyces sp. NBC_01478 TaxID=2903882 RepID=UPI002E35C358|nr:P-loop NTPase fold protein [Streptomyces sp. NBC_01478]
MAIRWEGDGLPRGSGFFVAPGLVLTASHVIPAPSEGSAEIRFPGGVSRAEVVWSLPLDVGSGLDMALVRLTEPLEHACVRLSDRRLEPGDRLWAYGFVAGKSPHSTEIWNSTFNYQGRQGLSWRLAGDRLPRGMSGGPVVDPVGAGACAIVTGMRRGESDGLAIPLSALQETRDPADAERLRELWTLHDEYHLRRQRGPAAPSYAELRRARTWAPAPDGTRSLAGLGSDRPSVVDLLGNEGHVDMLATLSVALDTDPPLAIALLGEWGVGKSSTMDQMHAQVAGLTERARRQPELRSAFAVNVRQVRFNAWHYAEEHLWTGLVDHLFRELARDPAAEELPGAEAELPRDRRKRLKSALDRATAEADRLRAVKDLAEQDAPTGRLSGLGSPRRILRVLRAEAVTVAKSLWTNRGILAARVAVLAVSLALWQWAGNRLSALLPLALGLGASVKPLWQRAVGLHKKVRAVGQGADERLDKDLREAGEQVAALTDQLVQVDAAFRFSALLKERADHGAAYVPYRSLLSQVRRDLEQMQKDLGEAHQEFRQRVGDLSASAAIPPLQRIILYIDDLDRCPPERVVEVLAAVHLMLALELFVVVVAVDARWLLSALKTHYRELFGPPIPAPDGVGPAMDSVGPPLDYLDKIFQIPFVVSRPSPGATSRYLRSLLGPPWRGEGADVTAHAETAEGTGTASGADGVASGTRRPSVAVPEVRDLRPDTLQLRADEIAFMASLASLVPTPRAAKKLVNLYRLTRIGVSAADVDAFLDGDFKAVQLLLAVVVGFPGAARTVLTALTEAPPEQDVREVLRTAAENAPEPDVKQSCLGIVAGFDELARRETPPPTAELYARWCPVIARFSFHTGDWINR